MDRKYFRLPAIVTKTQEDVQSLDAIEQLIKARKKEEGGSNGIRCCLEIKKVDKLPSIKRPEHLIYLDKISARKNKNKAAGNYEKMKRNKQQFGKENVNENNVKIKRRSKRKSKKKTNVLSSLDVDNHLKTNCPKEQARAKNGKMNKRKIEALEKENLDEISRRIKEIGRLRFEHAGSTKPQGQPLDQDSEKENNGSKGKKERNQQISIVIPS